MASSRATSRAWPMVCWTGSRICCGRRNFLRRTRFERRRHRRGTARRVRADRAAFPPPGRTGGAGTGRRCGGGDRGGRGAAPLGYLITISAPRDTPDGWFASFAAGLAVDQAVFGLSLLGGDTT